MRVVAKRGNKLARTLNVAQVYARQIVSATQKMGMDVHKSPEQPSPGPDRSAGYWFLGMAGSRNHKKDDAVLDGNGRGSAVGGIPGPDFRVNINPVGCRF